MIVKKRLEGDIIVKKDDNVSWDDTMFWLTRFNEITQYWLFHIKVRIHPFYKYLFSIDPKYEEIPLPCEILIDEELGFSIFDKPLTRNEELFGFLKRKSYKGTLELNFGNKLIITISHSNLKYQIL